MDSMKKGGLFGYNLFRPQDASVDRAIGNLNTTMKANAQKLDKLAVIAAKKMDARTPVEVADYKSLKKDLAAPLNIISKEAKNVNATFFTSAPRGGKSKKQRRSKKSKSVKKR